MKIITIFISILIAQSAGGIGSFFTASSVKSWYVDLIKPSLNPPSWVFGPVWLTLYTLMGIAAALIWQKRDRSYAKWGLCFYGIQLVLNTFWSILFFGMKNPLAALIDIILLLVLIIVATIFFWRVNVWAGVLMLPYILWVSFATYLNYSIWMMN